MEACASGHGGRGGRVFWVLAAALLAASRAAAQVDDGPSFATAVARPPLAADASSVPSPSAAPPGSTDGVDEVVVTGSRLTRDGFSGLGPISSLGAVSLERKGAFSVTELLRDLPSLGFAGVTANNTNGGRGLETVDLRSLGPSRTLILVNGRRVVQSSSGVGELVDLSSFPPALIDRIEVLRDGVSTIYGADAVAGVVNILLKKDYEGLELGLSGGASQRGDAEQGELGVLWGKNFARGNLTLAGSLSSRGAVASADRRFSRHPIRSAEPGPGGRLAIQRDFFRARGGRIQNAENPALNDLFFRPSAGRSFSSGFTEARDGTRVSDQFALNGELDRSAVHGLFTYEWSDALSWFSQATYSRRDGAQDFVETALRVSPTGKNRSGFSFPVFRPGDPRNNPFLPRDFLDAAFRGADGNPLPSSQESVRIGLTRSLGELGPRRFENRVRTLSFTTGLRGEVPELLGGLHWEVFGNYGRSDDTELTSDEVNLTRALRSAQPELCARDPRCVVGDFFGEGSLFHTPGALRYIAFRSRDRLRFDLRELGGSADASVLELPAGPVKAAIGAVYREEGGAVDLDPAVVSGDTAGNASAPTSGRQIVREAFFETELPLLRDRPGSRELLLEISGRYTEYSSFGGRYLSRYGFSWSPAQALRLRGVYATAFRAPGISDLFLGTSDSFEPVRDPCVGFPDVRAGSPGDTEKLRAACAMSLPAGRFTAQSPFTQSNGAGAQIRTNIGGNRELREETAKTWNLGAVFTPPSIPRLELSLDYYRIEIRNPIVGQDPQLRAERCLVDGAQGDCAAIERGADGQLVFIDARRVNFGEIDTNGLDLGVRYGFALPLLGDVDLDLQGSYILGLDVVSQAGRSHEDGLISGVSGATPNLKGRLETVIHPAPGWELQASARYIGAARDAGRRDLGLPFDGAPAVTYLDLSTRCEFGPEGKYSLSLGVLNAADRPPPRIIDGVSNTSLDSYDVVGRRFFAAVRGRFY